MCPLDFEASNKTSDSYASSIDTIDSVYLPLSQLTLTAIVVIPVTWYLIKKFRSYFGPNGAVNYNENCLAKPADVMQFLNKIHMQTLSDTVGSFQASLMIGPSLACIIFLLSE